VVSPGRILTTRGTINPMLYAITALLACLILVQLAIALSAAVWLRAKELEVRREISDSIHDLITTPDEDTPSKLAIYADLAATLLAARFIQQIKTMLNGVASGEARLEQAAQMQEALSGAPPWLGMLAGLLPKKLTRQLLNRPELVGALKGFAGGGGNHKQPSSSGGIQSRMHYD